MFLLRPKDSHSAGRLYSHQQVPVSLTYLLTVVKSAVGAAPAIQKTYVSASPFLAALHFFVLLGFSSGLSLLAFSFATCLRVHHINPKIITTDTTLKMVPKRPLSSCLSAERLCCACVSTKPHKFLPQIGLLYVDTFTITTYVSNVTWPELFLAFTSKSIAG